MSLLWVPPAQGQSWPGLGGPSSFNSFNSFSSFNSFNSLTLFLNIFLQGGWNSKDFLYVALGSGGDFRGFWTSGSLWRRILEDFLALGASWPRPELARAGAPSFFNFF